MLARIRAIHPQGVNRLVRESWDRKHRLAVRSCDTHYVIPSRDGLQIKSSPIANLPAWAGLDSGLPRLVEAIGRLTVVFAYATERVLPRRHTSKLG